MTKFNRFDFVSENSFKRKYEARLGSRGLSKIINKSYDTLYRAFAHLYLVHFFRYLLGSIRICDKRNEVLQVDWKK